jgi:hypothetical protein
MNRLLSARLFSVNHLRRVREIVDPFGGGADADIDERPYGS